MLNDDGQELIIFIDGVGYGLITTDYYLDSANALTVLGDSLSSFVGFV